MPSIPPRAHRTAGRTARLAALGLATLLAQPLVASARAATDPAPAAAPADPALAGRIASLHKRLGITPAQETLWTDFTTVMRQNAQEMQDQLAARKAQFASMNAVSDLQSFADLTAKRSSEIARLVPPLTALYASMSPSQKATADQVFRNRVERGVQRATPHADAAGHS